MKDKLTWVGFGVLGTTIGFAQHAFKQWKDGEEKDGPSLADTVDSDIQAGGVLVYSKTFCPYCVSSK